MCKLLRMGDKATTKITSNLHDWVSRPGDRTRNLKEAAPGSAALTRRGRVVVAPFLQEYLSTVVSHGEASPRSR